MSDLDGKLRGILEKAGVTYRKNMSAKDAAVDEIKQAFKDAGWIPYRPYYDIPEEQRRKAEWWSKTPDLRTGQEWYVRFVEELGNHDFLDEDADKVVAAAKKAAGIES